MQNPDEETYIKGWLTDHFPNVHFDVRFGTEDIYKRGPLVITYIDGPPQDEVFNYLQAMGLRDEAVNVIRREKPDYE